MSDTVALELQGVEALGRWSRPSRPPRRAPGPARAGRAAQGPLPSRTAALPKEPATPTLDGRAPTPRARPLRRGRRGPRRHRRCHRSRWCSQDHPGAGREHAGDTVRAEEGLGDHVRLQRKVPAQRRVAHSRRRSAVEHVGEGHRKSSFNQSASPGGGQRTECRWVVVENDEDPGAADRRRDRSRIDLSSRGVRRSTSASRITFLPVSARSDGACWSVGSSA